MSESQQVELIRRIAKDVVYEVLEEEKLLEPSELWDYLNAVDAGVTAARQHAKQRKGVAAVREETFNILKFDKQQGERIGEFEVAYKKANIPEKFQQAWNILNKNNAVIGDRYRGDGYTYSYWLYGSGKIYRQKLKRGAKG